MGLSKNPAELQSGIAKLVLHFWSHFVALGNIVVLLVLTMQMLFFFSQNASSLIWVGNRSDPEATTNIVFLWPTGDKFYA